MSESKTTAICLQMCPSLTVYSEQQVVACWEWSRAGSPFISSLVQVAPSGPLKWGGAK